MEDLTAVAPHSSAPGPRPSDPLGSQRGSSHLQRGGERPRTKRLGDPRTYATLSPEDGKGPGAASGFSPSPLAPHSSPPRPSPPETTQSHQSLRDFSAPRCGRADSPRTPAPGPTSAAGKNQPGGRGESQACRRDLSLRAANLGSP